MGRIVIKPAVTGVVFNLKADNGEIIATSQVYKTLMNAKKGIKSVIGNALAADVEDQTEPGFFTAKNPKFEIFMDEAGEYRFRLKARNGQIIAVSEGYKQPAACKKGIESVQKNAPFAEIVIED